MLTTSNCPKTVAKPSRDRFIGAVFGLWEERGAAGMSARQISQIADAPVSSIYHHFGSLEQLFLLSQQQCLAAAQDWCEQQIEQLSGFRGSPESFAGFFAHIVDEWAEGRRPLAFAWRECELLARRSPELAGHALRWRESWAEFWQQVGEVFSLGESSVLAERIFDSESLLHMTRWRRNVDHAALEETARGLSAWLSGKPAPAAPWREFARTQAMQSMPEPPASDAVAAQIRQAAAELMEHTGVAGVTHRAVAARAGLTLGTVSHKFRTKSALLEVAFEGLYVSLVAQLSASAPPQAPSSAASLAKGVSRAILSDEGFRSTDGLLLATARDPGLAGFAAQLRYLRGRSARASLQALLGEGRTASILEGALFSSFLTAQFRRHSGSPRDGITQSIEGELNVLAHLLGLRT